MRRTVYNSPNNPDDNQYSNSNDGGGLPEGWQQRSPSPSDNLPPRLTTEEMLEQQRIENQIRENNRRRRLEPSNGQAGGTQEGFSRAVRPRNDLNEVRSSADDDRQNTEIAGLRGNERIQHLIQSGAPLNQIIPPQDNNPNAHDAPPRGVDQPNPVITDPGAPMREQYVAVPRNAGVTNATAFFQNLFNNRFTAAEQQTFIQAQPPQQPVQQTPEQQAGEQRRQEAQQRIFEAQQLEIEALQRAAEAQQRVAQARQIALDLQIELALLNQDASPRTADLPTPAPQITATEIQEQGRENTPEPFPTRHPVDKSNFPGRQPGGGR